MQNQSKIGERVIKKSYISSLNMWAMSVLSTGYA